MYLVMGAWLVIKIQLLDDKKRQVNGRILDKLMKNNFGNQVAKSITKYTDGSKI